MNHSKTFKKLHSFLAGSLLFTTVIALAAFPLFAQFSSGSTGADGALSITTPGKTIFNPSTMGIDLDSDNVFNFTTINIAVGCTVRLGADIMGTRPVYWLASGNVTINGVVDLNGMAGHDYSAAHVPSIAGAGGYGGGVGYLAGIVAATSGEGPGGGGTGGCQTALCGYGAGAGYRTVGSLYKDVYNRSCTTTCAPAVGMMYGNKYLLPLIGGSGGGGGSYNGSLPCSGGGAGGGAILIAATGSIQINGRITAKGGYKGGQVNDGGGGCGSGGAIRIVANTVSGSGYIDVSSSTGSYFAAGSPGYIRIEAFTNTFPNANVIPSGYYGTPGLPLIPASGSLPSVRVVSINGMAVSPNPKGSYSFPDATINKSDSCAIVVQGKLIPVNTPVTLTLNSENEGAFTVTTPPLSGTIDSSSASVKVLVPPGYSRVMLNARW